VASVLGEKPAGEEAGPRRDRLQSILDAIVQQAADPDLDPARLAEPLGLSVRYLHRVLEQTGQTFSQHVLDQRLERAHRLLRDPRLAQSKISELALSAGFTDLSHFNRSYRRRFEETPSTTRANVALPENR
jgi:AraC-like DNA-binding protein